MPFKSFDQPRAGNSVNFLSFAGGPFHQASLIYLKYYRLLKRMPRPPATKIMRGSGYPRPVASTDRQRMLPLETVDS
jgi:hypothetical protein